MELKQENITRTHTHTPEQTWEQT